MLNEFIQRHQSNVITAAILGSVLSLIVAVVSAGLTYHYSNQSQDRQARLEQAAKFDSSSGDLIAAAGAFINAINNNNKDLDAARRQISSVVATQIYTSEDLRRAYGQDVDQGVKQYQSALTELNQTASQTSSVTEMRAWSETFGRVLDSKAQLSDEIYDSLGSKRRS